MKTTLKKLILFTIFLITILNCCTVCSANVQITNENLTSAFQKFESSEENKDKYSIKLENNQIKVTTSNGEVYIVNYTLESKPTFTLEMPVKDGMTYNDFKRQTQNLIIPVIGYLAVANIQGIEYKDSKAYFNSYLDYEFNGFLSKDNPYVVFDDVNPGNNPVIDNNVTIINASEFSSRVMEYVKNVYKDKQTINDSDDINSFEWSIEKQDIPNSTTTCKLISTVTINLDADFSKLKNYSNLTDGTPSQTIPANNVGSVTPENNDNEDIDNTTTNDNLPEVGKEIIVDIICIISLIILIVAMIRSEKYKGI